MAAREPCLGCEALGCGTRALCMMMRGSQNSVGCMWQCRRHHDVDMIVGHDGVLGVTHAWPSSAGTTLSTYTRMPFACTRILLPCTGTTLPSCSHMPCACTRVPLVVYRHQTALVLGIWPLHALAFPCPVQAPHCPHARICPLHAFAFPCPVVLTPVQADQTALVL